MAKAWMPFYINDYLADTVLLTLKQHGAYLLLIAHYWNHANAPANASDLHIICRCRTDADRNAVAYIVDNFFTSDGTRLFHKRIDQELIKASNISEKRTRAANSRYANAPANAMQMHTQSQSQSQSQSQKEKNKTSSSSSDDAHDYFDAFWKAYHRKIGKGSAEKAWKKIKQPASTLTAILTALEWQNKSLQWTRDNGAFIPHPATYLNQRRWEDEQENLPTGTLPTVPVMSDKRREQIRKVLPEE